MSAIRVESTGLDKMIESMERLAGGGAERAAARLDAHLAEGFAATQAAVHVRRGVTKESGRVMSSFTGSEWTGTIEYGIKGPEGEHATGAVWEIARGGEHDFLLPLGVTGEQIGEALDAYFKSAFEA